MESDDDYQIFSHTQEPSSPVHHRKLKRLKKSVSSSLVKSETLDQNLSKQIYSSPRGTDNEESHETLDSQKSIDSIQPGSRSKGLDDERHLSNAEEELIIDRDDLEDERALNVDEESHFGDADASSEGFSVRSDDLISKLREELESTEVEKSETKKQIGEENEEKKSKKKKTRKVGDKEKSEPPARTKRRIEKERKIMLEQLHAESQRLLRESRDAEFKPVVPVHKPISSILEKIRQRKLEVAKRANSFNTYVDSNESRDETVLVHSPKHCRTDTEGEEKHPKEDEDGPVVSKDGDHVDASDVNTFTDLLSPSTFQESPASPSQSENIISNMAQDEDSKIASQVSHNDESPLFNSQPSGEEGVQAKIQTESPVEEVLAPSALIMKLKHDAAHPDSSSDEEDNVKNVKPNPSKLVDEDLYPIGDPVKNFVDDEAEEEDDSDNDLMRFKDDEEDEENDSSEELKDLIVAGYKENHIDHEKRDQLHQMWLQQQDAAETDNVLQRLKFGPKQRDPSMLKEDEEDVELDDDPSDEDDVIDHVSMKNIVRTNTKKIKQMIPQMFTDKDDTFLSDEEETEQKLVRHRLLEKAEEDTSFLSPANDESSREVFGLIRKLNVAPDTKKKPKSSSIFDMLINGGNSNSSSRSSFLGRATSNSLPTSNKHASSNVRSFIFGRDDSNSRSGISMSDVSRDVDAKEHKATRTSSAKFSNSQSKCSTTQSRVETQTSGSSSLFEILKRTSSLNADTHTRKRVCETETVIQFEAFTSRKKPMVRRN